ncbi:MAG TPA: farnesyl diphosphate synthase, partial [Terriglobales bacterium]|nr:farnesyl diphosphate synthase [Terriglobales bacterium]
MDLGRYLAARQRQIDRALARHLDAITGSGPLSRAMRHGLLGGGKRIRPILCLAAAEAVGQPARSVLGYACAIELVHAYSLIHDDLPAMDDDQLRRGRPTTHVVYGEAVAILAGDALLTEAFHLIARQSLRSLASQQGLRIVAELGQAAGSLGMVAGQAEDILGEQRRLGAAAVEAIHRRKTGALIRAAVRIGAIAASASPAALRALTRYGDHLGLAFQIADDILDDQGAPAITGKSPQRDRERNKSTFVTALGLRRAQARGEEELRLAERALRSFGEPAEPLRALVRHVVGRARAAASVDGQQTR